MRSCDADPDRALHEAAEALVVQGLTPGWGISLITVTPSGRGLRVRLRARDPQMPGAASLVGEPCADVGEERLSESADRLQSGESVDGG